MKAFFCFVIFTSIHVCIIGQTQVFVSTDIDHFWEAYDKMLTTTDTLQQQLYIQELYLDRGSAGLKSLCEVRNYNAKSITDAITAYPKFWESMRVNSTKTSELHGEIESNLQKLKKLYPELRPSTIYFLFGAFRTGGTVQEDRVLIGCELSLGDETTFTAEFPEYRQQFYKDYRPRANLGLLCTHEYIHTQQKEPADNLLSYCVYEGVAEFLSCHATQLKSNSPAIEFGKSNEQLVVSKFAEDINTDKIYDWLWGENSNELKVRDLGYYIGYEICERYFQKSHDKIQAVKDLIELDYTNQKELERIVDFSGLLPKKIQEIRSDFEKNRPLVKEVRPIRSKSKKIRSGTTLLSIVFTEPMDIEARGLDYGPLGEAAIYEFDKIIGWSEDRMTFTIQVKTQPGKHYQFLITDRFRSSSGYPLVPYLVEFTTKKNKV